MVVDLLVKSKNGPKLISIPDINYFKMSDTNNTLYLYSANHKVHSIYNKDNIYCAVDHENFVLYPELDAINKNELDKTFSNRLNVYKLLIPEFDEDQVFMLSAHKQDHNVYTAQTTFQVFDGNRSVDVAVVNMKNIVGIMKVEFIKPEVDD